MEVKHMANLTWDFIEPLGDNGVLEAFEAKYCCVIPNDLKELMAKSNGGIPSQNVFDVPKKGMVISNLLSFNEGSEESVYSVLQHFLDGNKLTMVPFATDGFGNIYCQNDGEIVIWYHESSSIERITSSLYAFLELLHD